MRALVVSFYTHNLWQPWQNCSKHLSKQFLDFEPKIHFPQLQMLAGETGINQLRIYNPVKNSKEHDPQGIFVKKWITELENVPIACIHKPNLIPSLEQQFSGFFGKIISLPLSNLLNHVKQLAIYCGAIKMTLKLKKNVGKFLKSIR